MWIQCEQVLFCNVCFLGDVISHDNENFYNHFCKHFNDRRYVLRSVMLLKTVNYISKVTRRKKNNVTLADTLKQWQINAGKTKKILTSKHKKIGDFDWILELSLLIVFTDEFGLHPFLQSDSVVK